MSNETEQQNEPEDSYYNEELGAVIFVPYTDGRDNTERWRAAVRLARSIGLERTGKDQ